MRRFRRRQESPSFFVAAIHSIGVMLLLMVSQTQWAGQPKRSKRKDKARTIANRVGSHSHHVVTIREAPNTLKKMTIWIAPSLFSFTNFVFSITSNSRAKNKKQDAQTVQWSGVEWGELILAILGRAGAVHTRLHSASESVQATQNCHQK